MKQKQAWGNGTHHIQLHIPTAYHVSTMGFAAAHAPYCNLLPAGVVISHWGCLLYILYSVLRMYVCIYVRMYVCMYSVEPLHPPHPSHPTTIVFRRLPRVTMMIGVSPTMHQAPPVHSRTTMQVLGPEYSTDYIQYSNPPGEHCTVQHSAVGE